MKGCRVLACLVFSSMLLVVGLSLAMGVTLGVHESLVWEGDVYSSGVSVASPVLVSGTTYRIVAAEQWFYDNPNSLAADAQYYTNNSVGTWDWPNHYRPDSHSFLQIDGQDVDWGPFSNGHTGHTYIIYYNGADAPITFAIVDWMDSNYGNNFCHLHLRIYAEITVGGRVVDSSPSGTVSVFTVGALLLASVATVPVIVQHKKT